MYLKEQGKLSCQVTVVANYKAVQARAQRPAVQKALNKQGESGIITVWTVSVNELGDRASGRMTLLAFAALIHFVVSFKFGSHFGRLGFIIGWHPFVTVV